MSIHFISNILPVMKFYQYISSGCWCEFLQYNKLHCTPRNMNTGAWTYDCHNDRLSFTSNGSWRLGTKGICPTQLCRIVMEFYFTLENRYGFWRQTGCEAVLGCEAAFLVAQQRFPYRSRFNFSVKTWKICYRPMQSATQCISISVGKYIVEQMMHPLAFNRSSLSQMKAHKMWMCGMFWDILRQ